MRTLLAAMLMLLWAAPAPAVDMPGNDYTSFDAPSAIACRNSCGGDSKCQAFTWVKPGIQGASGRCWLKDPVPRAVANDCCQSGTHRSMSAASMKPENGVDRPGSDFKNFDTPSPASCENACASEAACRSWTFVSKGVQGPNAKCWLKNAVAPPVPNPKMISGVKFKGVSVRID
jgi:hypothetical protein